MPKTGWQAFAANNNLKFKFEIPLLRAAHVVGNFGRYQVRLETFSRRRQLSTASRWGFGYTSATIYTRMILRASKPLAAIAPDEALDKSKIFDLLIPKEATHV